jgi:hypothetical protein
MTWQSIVGIVGFGLVGVFQIVSDNNWSAAGQSFLAALALLGVHTAIGQNAAAMRASHEALIKQLNCKK